VRAALPTAVLGPGAAGAHQAGAVHQLEQEGREVPVACGRSVTRVLEQEGREVPIAWGRSVTSVLQVCDKGVTAGREGCP
jgi:hypothetical protein